MRKALKSNHLLAFLPTNAGAAVPGRHLLAHAPGRGACAIGAPTRATQLETPGSQQHCFSAAPWNMPSLTTLHLTYVLITLAHSRTLHTPHTSTPAAAPHLRHTWLGARYQQQHCAHPHLEVGGCIPRLRRKGSTESRHEEEAYQHGAE
jgi:hypothetical protein